MNEEQKKAEEEAAAAAAKQAEEDKAKADAEAAASQDLLKQELDKKRNKSGFTKLEKAKHARSKIDDEIAKLEEEEGVSPILDADDDEPVTVGMLKKRDQELATKKALDLAESIEDDTEKELVKHHLENTIRPSGNPNEDLRAARAIVNDLKNQKILEEIERKKDPTRNSSGNGAPAKKEGDEFVPSAEEIAYMKPPFNMTKEEIISARPKA